MHLDQLKISPLRITEIESLRPLAIKYFLDSYAHLNTRENMQDYLDKAFSLAQLSAEFQSPNSQFYTAKYKQQIIGYLKVNFAAAQTDLNEETSLEVERIYVAAAFQGKKVGKALMNKAKEIALDSDLDYLWLGVWQKNPSAIAFYEKIGFVAFGTHTFVFGDEAQTDSLMKYILKK